MEGADRVTEEGKAQRTGEDRLAVRVQLRRFQSAPDPEVAGADRMTMPAVCTLPLITRRHVSARLFAHL